MQSSCSEPAAYAQVAVMVVVVVVAVVKPAAAH
jgi:hypothetical protein